MAENLNPKFFSEISNLAEQINALNTQAYVAYLPLVNDFILSNKKDINEIEHLLDGLLPFVCYDNCLVLYKIMSLFLGYRQRNNCLLYQCL
jgi:hypothetical protein